MEQLELKEIVGYLPYGLKIQGFHRPGEMVLDSFEQFKVKDSITVSQTLIGGKPILRQLSDLTKEIEVNGDKFVPILELAKVSDTYYKWQIDNRSLFHCSAFCKIDGHKYRFSINHNGHHIFSLNTSLNGGFIQTNNPHKVVEKLYEWHFDIHNLINRGLAIDINTINYEN